VRCHITQPALTRQIRSLEDETGVPLFTRTIAGMEITPAGVALLRHARTIQAELEQARIATRQVERKERQPFDVGVFGSAMFNVIPRLLAEFSAKNPHAELRLYSLCKDQQIALLRQGKIQVSFDRFLPREADMEYELVHRERLWVALHKDHPLAAKETVDIGDLAGERCVGASRDMEMEVHLKQVFASPMPNAVHRADSVLTTLVLVSGGLCVGFAPPSLCSINMPNVVLRPCSGVNIPFDLMCMYRRDDRSDLLAKMLETVRAFRSAGEKTPPKNAENQRLTCGKVAK
jgi:DNA-binding transcriptional LysR family regulator